MADQAKSFDWRVRNAKKFDEGSEEILVEVLVKIGALVGFGADRKQTLAGEANVMHHS